MIIYQVGKVKTKKRKFIVFETNGIGYMIFVVNPDAYTLNVTTKIFVYEHKSDYAHDLYGFSSFRERYLFQDLIGVTGIGPKTAIGILRHRFENVVLWLANGDISAIQENTSISNRLAKQIVFELQEKYQKFLPMVPNALPHSVPVAKKQEIFKSLKSLGFPIEKIKKALLEIPNNNLPTEELVEKSIQLIVNDQ